jgi:hypothetical protein
MDLGLAPLVVLALIFGALVGAMMWNASGATAREVAGHRHLVQATVTGAVTVPPPSTPDTLGQRYAAPAVWTYPGQTRQTGTVPVTRQTPVGGKVTVLVDDKGRPAWPAASASERAAAAVTGGLWSGSLVVGVGIGCRFLARRRVSPDRLNAWEREWEEVEPVWSGRLRRGEGSPPDDD